MFDDDNRDLIGVPFKDGGRGLDGFDCWGLVSFVFAREGIFVPNYYAEAYDSAHVDSIIATVQGGWATIPRTDVARLDVLTFRLDPQAPQFVTHVGIYVGHGRFLQCLQKTGVIMSRMDDPFWKQRLAGCHRFRLPE